jgi:hypothetical protein
MDKLKFKHHLHKATKLLFELTKTLCYNDLHDNCRYVITPNSRTVDEHLSEEEILILKKWNQYEGKLLTANQIIDFLHHNNKVPVWIDMTIYEAKSDVTVINLFCSRRLRHEAELMHPGVPPFHVLVSIPPENLKAEINGRFDVNWIKKHDDNQKPKGILNRLKKLIKKN